MVLKLDIVSTITEYVNFVRPLVADEDDGLPLILQGGKALTPSYLREMFLKFSSKCGLSPPSATQA